MFNSQILEVAIGMVFVYLLLSLICSAINEGVEAQLKNRASDLQKGIRRLLEDPGGSGWAAKLYDHALIRGLYRDGKHLPSYIPARNFALALMDLVAPASPRTTSGAAGATLSPPAAAAAVVTGTSSPPSPPPASLALSTLRASVASNTTGKVQEALLALIDAAGNDANKARQNIEAWYNSAMDRVAGWYKRRTQAIIFCLGYRSRSRLECRYRCGCQQPLA